MSTQVLTRNDHLYLTASCRVINPTQDEIASYSFANSVAQTAPNENIIWLEGEYVEGDSPNRNGQMWTSDELAIKSLTPRLMPVTIMHDYRTAVGVIADVRLEKNEDQENGSFAGSKIKTILALWSHRFPEVAQEVLRNHEQGMLMQSMECDAPQYECSECSTLFTKPVDPDEHCSHLKDGTASRTLCNVTFTGTGLIFGTRGAEGANPRATLDTVKNEVAKWSDAIQGKTKRSTVDEITLKRNEYDELASRPTADQLDKASKEAASLRDEKAELESKIEKIEITAKKSADELAEATKKIEAMEEEANSAGLAKSRISEIPKELAEALPDSIMGKLTEQARSLSDDDWKYRIEELAELVDVKPDGEAAGDTFSEKAMASFNTEGKSGAMGAIDISSLGASLGKALNKAR